MRAKRNPTANYFPLLSGVWEESLSLLCVGFVTAEPGTWDINDELSLVRESGIHADGLRVATDAPESGENVVGTVPWLR